MATHSRWLSLPAHSSPLLLSSPTLLPASSQQRHPSSGLPPASPAFLTTSRRLSRVVSSASQSNDRQEAVAGIGKPASASTSTSASASASASSSTSASTSAAASSISGRRQLLQAGFVGGAAAVAAALPQTTGSTSAWALIGARKAMRDAKIPESEYTVLPNGLKYYDQKIGSGRVAEKGDRVTVHYVVKWNGVTFMTSRQGLGVTGGTPYGFDLGASELGFPVLKGLDLGVEGMRVGGQRQLIVPPELAYGSKGVQEIPPGATLDMNVELLAVKESSRGYQVKLIEG